MKWVFLIAWNYKGEGTSTNGTQGVKFLLVPELSWPIDRANDFWSIPCTHDWLTLVGISMIIKQLKLKFMVFILRNIMYCDRLIYDIVIEIHPSMQNSKSLITILESALDSHVPKSLFFMPNQTSFNKSSRTCLSKGESSGKKCVIWELKKSSPNCISHVIKTFSYDREIKLNLFLPVKHCRA